MLRNILLASLSAALALAHPTGDESFDELMKRAPNPGVVIRNCASPGMLALAYDDGPYQFTSQLVDTLNAAGAKATFFVTGTLYGNIYNSAAAVQKAYNSGHQIASHTWSHKDLATMNSGQITSEMQQLENALQSIIGRKPRYMRPPYLSTGGQALSTLGSLGYIVITNDVDAGDWNGQSPAQSQQVFQRAGTGGNGHIPLMHETYASTVQQLTPWLINWAKSNNLRLVTVAECLGNAGGAYR